MREGAVALLTGTGDIETINADELRKHEFVNPNREDVAKTMDDWKKNGHWRADGPGGVGNYCCTVQSGDAALSNQKLPRVASRGREVEKSRQTPFRG